MKPEEILKKVTDGELSGDALNAEVEKLDLAGQAELIKLSKESATKSLSEASGLRKERDRANDMKTQAEKDAEEARIAAEAAKKPADPVTPPANNDTMSQFRNEQKDKAISRIKAELSLTDEQLRQVVEHFNKIDSKFVDSDLIYNELKGAYAFINRDALLEAGAERQKREAEAAAADAEAAGGASGAPSGSTPPKFSDSEKKLATDAGITPEAAKKVLTEGTKRVFE